MDIAEQKQIQEHFERMYQFGQKPWTEHRPEPSLGKFFEILRTSRLAKFTLSPIEGLARRVKVSIPAKILDIGCGNGWISIKAAKAGFEVWGIDSSETAIEEAIETAKDEGIEGNTDFQVGDALNLPYDESFFDALIDRGLFHHILPENRIAYFDNILRVLRSESLIYISVFSDKNPVGIGQLFTKELMEGLFGKNFTSIYYKEDPHLSDSPAHLLHFTFECKS